MSGPAAATLRGPQAPSAGAAWSSYGLAAPALLLVGGALVVPLVMLFRLSVFTYDPSDMYRETVTAENYLKFFGEGYYRGILWRTLGTASLTTGLTLAAGLTVAYFMARARSAALRRYLLIAIVLPLFLGNVVRTAGWLVALDNTGIVNVGLLTFGLVRQPLPLLYTTGTVVVGLTSVLLPYMIVTLHSVLEGIDPALEDASANLGAGRLTTFRRIVLPQLVPGITAGSTLCFILAMNAYATPRLLGGPELPFMGPAIYGEIGKSLNWPFGAAMAFVLIAITAALTLGSGLLLARRRA